MLTVFRYMCKDPSAVSNLAARILLKGPMQDLQIGLGSFGNKMNLMSNEENFCIYNRNEKSATNVCICVSWH